MMEVIDMHRPGDGRQELTLVLRNPVQTFLDLFRDPRANGHQYYSAETYTNEHNEPVFYHSNGCLSYQQAQLEAGPGVTPVSCILYCDGTFSETSKEFRTVYGK